LTTYTALNGVIIIIIISNNMDKMLC